MTKTILSLIGCCLIQVLAFGQKAAPVYEFKNGNWYDGEGFTPGTWYTVDGKFTKKTPAKVDSVFDLAGRWVVPPLADAYCSSLTGNPSAPNQLNFCTEEGIFYLQVLGNSLEDRKAVASLVNKANGPDVAFANGGVTCTLGYPFLQFEGPAQGIRNPQLMKQQYDKLKLLRSMEGNGYWYMDSKAAVGKAWEKIKTQSPNLISIYLLDVANSGGKEGKGGHENGALRSGVGRAWRVWSGGLRHDVTCPANGEGQSGRVNGAGTEVYSSNLQRGQ